MEHVYFSDREEGPRTRASEEISEDAWKGIVAIIERNLSDGSFGHGFPEMCPDGCGVCGCSRQDFFRVQRAEISDIPWPLDECVPPTLAILDFLEFCHRSVAQPIEHDWHDFFRHSHLTFDVAKGQERFRDDINRILSRNRLAFELCADGRIVRVGPPFLRETLQSALFETGDKDLDALLEVARIKYFDPDFAVRKESLEKLWDAWERLKTVEPGKDKKASTEKLLERTAIGCFREMLESEAHELTRIGNQFRIRHSETDKTPVDESEQVDYLLPPYVRHDPADSQKD